MDAPSNTKAKFNIYPFLTRNQKMPLIKSKSKAAIGKNIAEMQAAGHPKAQAVAAALSTARKAGAHIPKKKGKK